jgi:hypothetical protein
LSRPARIALIATAVAVFLVASFFLARVLTVPSAERSAVVALVRDAARGDAGAAAARLDDCRAACARGLRATVARVAAPGRVEVLNMESSAGTALSAGPSTVRVAWRAGTRLPVVQCVATRRTGSVVRGFEVHLLRLGPPIGRESACPR